MGTTENGAASDAASTIKSGSSGLSGAVGIGGENSPSDVPLDLSPRRSREDGNPGQSMSILDPGLRGDDDMGIATISPEPPSAMTRAVVPQSVTPARHDRAPGELPLTPGAAPDVATVIEHKNIEARAQARHEQANARRAAEDATKRQRSLARTAQPSRQNFTRQQAGRNTEEAAPKIEQEVKSVTDALGRWLNGGQLQDDAAPTRALPSLSAEQVSSNRRLATALGKRRGVGDLPRFTVDAIETHGDKAVAEIADLIGTVGKSDPEQARELFQRTRDGIGADNVRRLDLALGIDLGTDGKPVARNMLLTRDDMKNAPPPMPKDRMPDWQERDRDPSNQMPEAQQISESRDAGSPSSNMDASAPPIPADKRQWFKGKEHEWAGFHDAVDKLPGVGPVERATYMHIFGREGGMAKDPNGTASSGIMQDTADRFLGKGDLQHVAPGTPPAKLPAEDRARIYRHYMDDEFRAIGGYAVLDQIGDEMGATALADGMFRLGQIKAAEALQKAMKSIDPTAPKIDSVFGSRSLSAYKRLLADPKTRNSLLDAVADNFTEKAPLEKSRWNALRPRHSPSE